jgi:hypothetical protein
MMKNNLLIMLVFFFFFFFFKLEFLELDQLNKVESFRSYKSLLLAVTSGVIQKQLQDYLMENTSQIIALEKTRKEKLRKKLMFLFLFCFYLYILKKG